MPGSSSPGHVHDGVTEGVAFVRPGGIHAHLVHQAVVGGRVQPRALGAGHHHQIPRRLESCGNGPLDFHRVVNVHIVIDDDDLLDVGVAGKRAHDDVLGLALPALGDLHVQVITAYTAP